MSEDEANEEADVPLQGVWRDLESLARAYVDICQLLVSEQRRNDALQAQLAEFRALLASAMGKEWVDEALKRQRSGS